MDASIEWNPNLDQELADTVRPQLREIAETVAAGTQANIRFPGGRSGPVEVSDTERGVRVAMTGPFAHLEEWGGARSAPTAPLRRAIEATGLDFEER